MRRIRVSSAITDYVAYPPEGDSSYDQFPYGVGMRVYHDEKTQRASSFYFDESGVRQFFINRGSIQNWPIVTDKEVEMFVDKVEYDGDIEVV